jgi:hypothetical protein
MRPSLLHPKRGDRRHPRRGRGGRRNRLLASDIAEPKRTAAEPNQSVAEPKRTDMRRAAPTGDAAAQRVRAAGGPLDRASYTCQCGYVFAAAVTTTVACPHCGDTQAW